MKVLRHEENDEPCPLTCNGVFDTPWSKTMVGYGPEDTSYAEGFLSVWDEYLSQIESFASRRMYMLNFGNHEQVRSAADGPARPGPHVPL